MEHGEVRHISVSLVWHRGLPSIVIHHYLKPPLNCIQGCMNLSLVKAYARAILSWP